MRIITGSARGCQLKTPKGAAVTRPTSDRVKESLFNILGAMVQGRKVLDVFAGTGNLGLEALSRGASSAVAVDQATAPLIRENAKRTHLIDKLEIKSGEALAVLSRLAMEQREFTLIFCDPPYHKGLWEKTLQFIDASTGLMARDGILVVEHGADENAIPELQNLVQVMNRRYGHTTQLSFYQWRDYIEEDDA